MSGSDKADIGPIRSLSGMMSWCSSDGVKISSIVHCATYNKYELATTICQEFENTAPLQARVPRGTGVLPSHFAIPPTLNTASPRYITNHMSLRSAGSPALPEREGFVEVDRESISISLVALGSSRSARTRPEQWAIKLKKLPGHSSLRVVCETSCASNQHLSLTVQQRRVMCILSPLLCARHSSSTSLRPNCTLRSINLGPLCLYLSYLACKGWSPLIIEATFH